MYDVIVIGGGVAGLAACQALPNLDVLLLEKDDRLGGRVLTRHREGLTYDVGAMIGYDPSQLPFQFPPSRLIREDLPMGIYYRSRLGRGMTVDECLDVVCAGHPALRRAVTAFKTGARRLSELSPEARRLVRGLFKAIHPGEIDAYDPAVRGDAFVRYSPSHWSGGNAELIEALARRIGGPIRYRAVARRVTREGNSVLVSVEEHGGRQTFRGRTVIVATPATTAVKLIQGGDPITRRRLAAVRYAGCAVVVIGFARTIWSDLSYTLTPQREMDVVYQQRGPNDRAVCLAYYGERASRRVSGRSAPQLVDQVLDVLRATGSAVTAKDILFSDVTRWEIGGTVLSATLFQASRGAGSSGDAVVLAGDYAWDPYPYGTQAAIRSGVAAAHSVLRVLQRDGGARAGSPDG